MKLSEIRFTWYVDIPGLAQPRQRFKAPEYDLEWLVELGCLSINGWCVSTAQAVWLPMPVSSLPTAEPERTDAIVALEELTGAPLREEFDGGHQPGPPAGPAAKGRRSRKR